MGSRDIDRNGHLTKGGKVASEAGFTLIELPMKKLHKSSKSYGKQTTGGFTLIEVLVVVAMIGILSAIGVPSWLAFTNSQRLNTARDQVYLAMKEAQSNAKRDKLTWQASFREGEVDGQPVTQWAVHLASVSPHEAPWQNLDPSVRIVDTDIDSRDRNETTFYRYSSGVNEGVWRVRFNYHGHPNSVRDLGRLTLASRNSDPTNRNRKLRCVYLSTLLGSMRTSSQQRTKKDDRYCY